MYHSLPPKEKKLIEKRKQHHNTLHYSDSAQMLSYNKYSRQQSKCHKYWLAVYFYAYKKKILSFFVWNEWCQSVGVGLQFLHTNGGFTFLIHPVTGSTVSYLHAISRGGVLVFSLLQQGSWLSYMLMCSGRTYEISSHG